MVMHYIGLLAFQLPVPVLYDGPLVAASLLAAILASGIALYAASREKMGMGAALTGSVFMGTAIAGMHYIGMAAMRQPAECHYSTWLVSVSVVLAIVISFVALLLTFHFRNETKSWNVRLQRFYRGERTGSGCGRGAGRVRSNLDGHTDAGNGRIRGDGGDSRAGTSERAICADCRDDGACIEGRRRSLPGQRDGRVYFEADPQRAILSDG